MTKEEVGAWCKEIADQINSDPILLDVFTRAYCTEEEEHMSTREELEQNVMVAEDTWKAGYAVRDGQAWCDAWSALEAAEDALYDYDKENT